MKIPVAKCIAVTLAVALLLGGVAWGAIAWNIHQSVQQNCAVAQRHHPHPGDDVAALIEFLNCESHCVQDRSHLAVWTLGRLRDPAALPALESVHTGEACQHDSRLCQYELEKAIERCGGESGCARQTKH